ncbi:hypothetical protein BR93DRAFT_937403 [Coniochaeta sp. PMI_546]|nr:hypothetical protein BR93DRAFT_937403 [Coniochaeta sp. PMI_546]
MSEPAKDTDKPTGAGLALEAWAQGFMVGALVIMATITLANMRRGAILHKLVLIELLLGMPHGFFIFFDPPVYSWYLSCSAIPLNMSWSLHNFIAWMKNKPFLSRKASWIYIGTVIAVQPYWVLEIAANFTYFNKINDLFIHTRPFEALCRDPWWIFTTVNLFWNIKYRYNFGFVELARISPRFAIMMASMCVSVIFILIDILSVTKVLSLQLANGINPFWKLAFVFKCLTDTIILDDFKTALDKLSRYKLDQIRDISGASGNHGTAARDQWLELSRGRSEVTRGNGQGGLAPLGGIRVDVETQVERADVESTKSTTQRSMESTTDILGMKGGKMM